MTSVRRREFLEYCHTNLFLKANIVSGHKSSCEPYIKVMQRGDCWKHPACWYRHSLCNNTLMPSLTVVAPFSPPCPLPYILGCFAGTQQGHGCVCNYRGWNRNNFALSPWFPNVTKRILFWDSWWCLAKINKIFHQETWELFPQEASNH